MSTSSSQEDFVRKHWQIYSQLQKERQALEAEMGDSPVLHEVADTFDQVLQLTNPGRCADPVQAFQAGLQAMDEVERRRFLIDNYLEGLKRGELPSMLWERYQHLQLIQRPPPVPTQRVGADGWAAMLSKKAFKRLGLAAAQVAVNAMTVIPQLVKIKPSISIVGFVPVLSFELELDDVSVWDLFDMLRQPGSIDAS